MLKLLIRNGPIKRTYIPPKNNNIIEEKNIQIQNKKSFNKTFSKNKQNIIINNNTNFNLIPFTKIIYINLDDRTDRRKTFENFYKNEEISPIRFSAKKTSLYNFKRDHPELTISNTLTTSNNIRWVNGTLGCYESHYTILKNHVNDNNAFLVVLEDDCTIKTQDLNKCLNLLQNNQNIDILRINCWLPIPYNPYLIERNNRHSKYFDGGERKYFDGGTHCCIYHIKNIPKVLKFMKNENVFQVDALFSNNVINSVIYKIPPKIKYFSQSSIQKDTVDRNSVLFNKLMLKKRKL